MQGIGNGFSSIVSDSSLIKEARKNEGGEEVRSQELYPNGCIGDVIRNYLFPRAEGS